MVYINISVKVHTMGFLFRKRIRLLPGLWINLNKRGVSASIVGKSMVDNIKNDNLGADVTGTADIINYGKLTRSPYNPASRRASLSKWYWMLLILLAGSLLLAFQP